MKKSGRLGGLFRILIDPDTELREAWNSGRPGRSGVLKVVLVLVIVLVAAVLLTMFPEFFDDGGG